MNIKNIKMVVVDLDGTSLCSNQLISQKTIDIFKKLKEDNIITVVATGRMPFESIFVREYLNIDYMITGNGALIHDYIEDKQIFEGYIEKDVSIKIVDIITSYDMVLPMMFLDGAPYCGKKFEKYILQSTLPEGYIENFSHHINYVDDYNTFIRNTDRKVNKIYIDTLSSKEISEDVNNKLSMLPSIKTVFSFKNILDILPIAVDKGKSLERLTKYLDIDMSFVMAIGDNDNDIEMLQVAGISVAMGNANDNIKSIADYVVSSNDNDGVFEAINQIIY